jgi:GDP-mannose 6-dehydrogenase
MTRSISVFGLGYVGSVSAACFAKQGFPVVGVDLNRDKVQMMASGRSPILEPGMSELIAEAHKAGLLRATMDVAEAVENTDISILCVGTPSMRSGKLDLGHIEPVCRQIGEVLGSKKGFHLVVLRSTVLPGTADTLVVPTLEKASGKRSGKDFGVCSNPEFLREGSAVKDFMEPAMTVIGAADPAHSAFLREIYAWAPGRIFETSFTSAEMVKYVCNSWHALKVAFANEVGSLAKELDVDPEAVVEIFCTDTKLNISPAYLKPGFAFGGSCLPKDVRALSHRGREMDLKLPLFESILPSNDRHLDRAVDMILRTGKKKIGLLGLSFKAHTDDLRESPQVILAKRLLGEGRQLLIWDENVTMGRLIGSNRQYIEEEIPHLGEVLGNDLAKVVGESELIVVATRVDREELRRLLRPDQKVIDLVNLNRARRPDGGPSYEGICW